MIHTGLSPKTGRPVCVNEQDGRITSVEPATNGSGSRWIAPGMIDIQVNGFAGVDYNSPATPIDEIARSIAVIRSTGVTRFYPTVITGSNQNIRGAFANLARAKRELAGGESIPGFHLEGPWISPVDGPRGAHPQEHVRPASADEFQQFQDAAEGLIRLVTVAPETAGALAMIEYLVERDIVVSLGHTNANDEHIRDAVSAGATMSTHLGNGAHYELHRSANYIIDQMANDELCASLIVDGIHLPPNFVKVAVRAKGLDRSILTTDAVAPADCEPGIYHLGDLEVELLPDNRVELTSTRRLAGSALRMDRGLENLMHFADISLYQALRMATVNAAAGMGLEGRRGFLEPGDLADLIVFEFEPEENEIRMVETICAAAA